MKQGIVATIGALLLAFNTFAADDDFLQLLDQENAVFAASRYVQSLEETPASVSVNTREEMERFGYYSLEQSLFALPGVYNASNLAWPMFGIRGVAKPGDICSRFLVLLNGMPAVYDPVFGGTCFQMLDIESLKRVEFVRGPGSSIYGSGGALGVINLVTEDAADFHGFRFSSKASTQNEAQVYGSWADTVYGTQSYVSASGKKRIGVNYYFPEYDSPPQTNGQTSKRDGQDLYRIFGRFVKDNAWLQVRYEKNRKVDPQARFQTVFDTDRLVYDDRSLSVELASANKFAGDSELLWRAYVTKFDEFGFYPYYASDPDTGDTIVSQGNVDSVYLDNIDSRQYGIELRYDTFLMGGQHFLTGVDIRYVSGRQYGGVENTEYDHDFFKRYAQGSFYAQDEIAVGVNGRLTLGGRFDYYRNYSAKVDWRVNPRAAYIHRINSDITAKLLYSEAYRVPTLYEVYYDDGVSKLSNIDLKPEVVRTVEAMFDYIPQRNTKLSTSVYLTRLQDSIVLQNNQYANIAGYQQVIGIESNLEAKRDNGLTSYLALTLQRGEQYPERIAMASSPGFIAKAGLSHPLPFYRWGTAVEAKYLSETYGVFENGSRRPSSPAYWLVDWTLASGEIWKELKMTGRIDNVFNNKATMITDASFDPIYLIPVSGRTASLKLEWSF